MKPYQVLLHIFWSYIIGYVCVYSGYISLYYSSFFYYIPSYYSKKYCVHLFYLKEWHKVLVSIFPNSQFIQDGKVVVIVQIYCKVGEWPRANWDKILWLRHTIDLQSGRKGWGNSSFWKLGQQNTLVHMEEYRKPRARYMFKNTWEDTKFISQANP